MSLVDKFKEISLEEDQDKRLELSGALNEEITGLEEFYSNKETYEKLDDELNDTKAQLESATNERDEWKQKYADRFFEVEETINKKYTKEVKDESRPLGYAALWQNKE